jgi:hypothetical protein
LSHWGSVSGALIETSVWANGRLRSAGACEGVVVAALWVHSHKRGAASFGSKCETELLELDIECANENGGGDQWKEVVGWHVQGGGSGGKLCSLAQVGAVGIQLKV